jgi:hypothetical protein
MVKRVRTILLITLAAAFAVFAVVQDHVTAAGARQYVSLQREALAGQVPAVTIDQVMAPAVERSVRLGLLWGGVVLLAGFGVAAAASRWARPPRHGGPPTGGPSSQHRLIGSRSDPTLAEAGHE